MTLSVDVADVDAVVSVGTLAVESVTGVVPLAVDSVPVPLVVLPDVVVGSWLTVELIPVEEAVPVVVSVGRLVEPDAVQLPVADPFVVVPVTLVVVAEPLLVEPVLLVVGAPMPVVVGALVPVAVGTPVLVGKLVVSLPEPLVDVGAGSSEHGSCASVNQSFPEQPPGSERTSVPVGKTVEDVAVPDVDEIVETVADAEPDVVGKAVSVPDPEVDAVVGKPVSEPETVLGGTEDDENVVGKSVGAPDAEVVVEIEPGGGIVGKVEKVGSPVGNEKVLLVGSSGLPGLCQPRWRAWSASPAPGAGAAATAPRRGRAAMNENMTILLAEY